MHWNGNWHMGSIGLWWILILPVLFALIWYPISAARRHGNSAQESPEQILKRHYANGEIDDETYQRKLATLRE